MMTEFRTRCLYAKCDLDRASRHLDATEEGDWEVGLVSAVQSVAKALVHLQINPERFDTIYRRMRHENTGYQALKKELDNTEVIILEGE